MKNGLLLAGVRKVAQCKVELPEMAYVKEIQWVCSNGTLMVFENTAAEDGTEFVLWEGGPLWEVFEAKNKKDMEKLLERMKNGDKVDLNIEALAPLLTEIMGS